MLCENCLFEEMATGIDDPLDERAGTNTVDEASAQAARLTLLEEASAQAARLTLRKFYQAPLRFSHNYGQFELRHERECQTIDLGHELFPGRSDDEILAIAREPLPIDTDTATPAAGTKSHG